MKFNCISHTTSKNYLDGVSIIIKKLFHNTATLWRLLCMFIISFLFRFQMLSIKSKLLKIRINLQFNWGKKWKKNLKFWALICSTLYLGEPKYIFFNKLVKSRKIAHSLMWPKMLSRMAISKLYLHWKKMWQQTSRVYLMIWNTLKMFMILSSRNKKNTKKLFIDRYKITLAS